jgi:hypothetical protein
MAKRHGVCLSFLFKNKGGLLGFVNQICGTRIFPKRIAWPQISFNQPIWGVTVEIEN